MLAIELLVDMKQIMVEVEWWESEAGRCIWQAPSSGEVGGSRSGAETRLTGISAPGHAPESADATSQVRASQAFDVRVSIGM